MNKLRTAPTGPTRATAYLHFGGAFCGMPNGPFQTAKATWLSGNVEHAGTVYQAWQADDGTLYIMDRDKKPMATIQIFTSAMSYHVMHNVGRCKYLTSYCDGTKTHKDGSAFFDAHITNNKRTHQRFINQLKKQGYREA